jgi:predicted Zn-dependent protease
VRSALTRLAKMSQGSNDKLIETAYHGAAGAVALSENKYKEAVSHLEEDTNNPLSLELLAVAYQNTGDRAEAQRTSETLANLNDVTLEQALVVPAFRRCYADPACGGNVKAGDKKGPRHESRPLLL